MLLSDIADERQSEIEKAIEESKRAGSGVSALRVLLDALNEVREAVSEAAISEVSVNNLDEVRASLRNELNRVSKPIVSAIKGLALDRKKIEEMTERISQDNAQALDLTHDIQIVRKPKTVHEIANLRDIVFPGEIAVTNLSELQAYFNDLADVMRGLNFTVPAPQVTVNPPSVNVPEIRMPEIMIPAPIVNVDGGDFTPLLEVIKALKDTLRRTSANQTKQMTAFSNGGINKHDLKSVMRAGTNTALSTSSIYNGSTELTPKFAVIDVGTSGNNTIVSAVASKKIRVLQLYLVSAGTVNVRFESGANGTALSGQMNLIANTGFVLPFSPLGWFETAAGVLLNLELSGAVAVDGSLTYIEV